MYTLFISSSTNNGKCDLLPECTCVVCTRSYLNLHIALVAEWLRVRLRVRMVRGSTLTVGNFLSLENLNVIIRAIN